MKVTNLKTCHMRDAFGIDETPYFSWWLESNQENVMQEAYRICVADEKSNTVWDSGKVESSQNTFVPYEVLCIGKPGYLYLDRYCVG